MEITLSQTSVEAIAKRVADILLQRQSPEWVDTDTAARLLNITPEYLRRTKARYRYRKEGVEKQSRLLFDKASLMT